ncbi:MAG: hypothetical protein H6733_12575 [Alphaproteobacteria bacterium]|nr:hypothetical protein [Alphaproteobacteria bacterium]
MRGPGLAGLLLLTACTSNTDGKDDTGDTNPDVVGCDGDGTAALEVGQDLREGVAHDGITIDYGNPPQGGAPYAPFQIRLRAVLDGQRTKVSASAIDTDTGQEIGSALQEQGFLCSNTGTHEGWLYGGEVHLRFWGWSLDELVDVPLSVTITVDLPDDQQVSETFDGVLAWTL